MARTRKDKRRSRKARGINAALAKAAPRTTAMPQEDPCRVVIEARSRRLGIPPGDAALPIWGDPVGAVIASAVPEADAAHRLWQVFCDLDAARSAFFRRILGRPPHPAVMRMEMLPDRFETRSDDRPDLRTEADKDADARNRWHRWQRRLHALPIPQRLAVTAAATHPEAMASGVRAHLVSALRTLDAANRRV